MEKFIQRFGDKIIGVLTGFDRVVIRGTLRPISTHTGMREFLYQNGVLMKNFKEYSTGITNQLRAVSRKMAEKEGRPFIYLPSPKMNKEQVALQVLQENPIQTGTICMISCVEPSKSFSVRPDRETKRLRVQCEERMCLHIYHYLIHPEFGFMNARIQTWFPFSIQFCINGREWLSRMMDRSNIKYNRLDNCFPWISDISAAQKLMDKQLKTNWPSILGRMVRRLNPLHTQIFRKMPLDYYWSTTQTEWATDLMFRSRSDLAPIYAAIVSHATNSFSSPDVMRFLGRKLRGNFAGEVVSDYKERLEGVRIKHRVGTNSVKLYDKFQIILRIETTINNPRDFRVFRPLERDPEGTLAWQKMRQGIADLHRRTQVSNACNGRYLDALSEVDSSLTLGQLIDNISKPTVLNGKRVRALRPWDSKDLELFKAVTDARFFINGFRNRDLQAVLYNQPASSEKEKRQRSGRICRLIRILRAHHLVKRVPKSYRYLLTTKGAEILTAILSLRKISLEKFKQFAA